MIKDEGLDENSAGGEGRGVDLEASRRGFGDWSDLERDDGEK